MYIKIALQPENAAAAKTMVGQALAAFWLFTVICFTQSVSPLAFEVFRFYAFMRQVDPALLIDLHYLYKQLVADIANVLHLFHEFI